MLRTLWSKLQRRLVALVTLHLPKEQREQIQRRIRGRHELRRLERADLVVVSLGKSGRTWIRVMLSGFYHAAYGLPGRDLLGFDNFHRRDPRVPRVLFTHDNYLKDYTGNAESKSDFAGRKVVLLVRDPRDVSVSQFFQWRFRMKPEKIVMNRFPPREEDLSLFEFIMRPECGVPRAIEFMNLWANAAPRLKDLLVVRYEDLRREPLEGFTRIVRFIGAPVDEAAIRHAVEYASVENMRAMEEKGSSWLSGGRMRPGDPGNPDSYKVRRAKVGGYRDYLEDDQAARVDELVKSRLSPLFGYGDALGPLGLVEQGGEPS